MPVKNKTKPQDDLITPARRAFARVARKVREENRRLGLPLIVGENGKVRFISLSPKKSSR
jgi:hypothetical protein